MKKSLRLFHVKKSRIKLGPKLRTCLAYEFSSFHRNKIEIYDLADWPSIPEADGQLQLSPSEGAPSETWRLTQMGSDVKASHLTVSLLLAGIVPPPFVEFWALKSGCHSANAFRWPPKVIDLLAFSLSLPDTRVLCYRPNVEDIWLAKSLFAYVRFVT